MQNSTCVAPPAPPDSPIDPPLALALVSLRGVVELAGELAEVLGDDGDALADEPTREWVRASIRQLRSVTADACISLGEAVEERGR